MTLIVLLILAGVSISSLFSEKGLFGRTENAGNRYNEAKAREVLETVLLTDGQMEKQTNPQYNQDDFLDDLIKKEITGADIEGDVVKIGEYAYELDRSVPKIGRYLGNPKNLIFPTVTASEAVLADNYRTASFEATAIEEKNGINKIEIWFAGERIETLTKTYSDVKTEIKETFTVNKNGVYTIKAYGELMASVKVEVTGIVPTVEFTPNGNTNWKKEHTTKITVKEAGEKVTSLKYKWTTNTQQPEYNEFTKECSNNSTITGSGNDMTGQYYLWILVETENGKKSTYNSNAFYFDNIGPKLKYVNLQLYTSDFSEEGSIAFAYEDEACTWYSTIKDANFSYSADNEYYGEEIGRRSFFFNDSNKSFITFTVEFRDKLNNVSRYLINTSLNKYSMGDSKYIPDEDITLVN